MADQAIKLLVHFYMDMGPGGEIAVFGDWFKLHYILNNGMAFGLRLDSLYGKLGLTLFRLFAAGLISFLILSFHQKGFSKGLLWCMAAVLGGALGNLVDSIFYGVLLDNAPYNAISPWFHGQVIDVFYFDFWEGYLPEWMPFWAGQKVALWPIFNLADAAIFAGVFTLLIFQKRFLTQNRRGKYRF